MFDIQTEAYLRRNHPRDTDRPDRPDGLIAGLVAATLVLWTAIAIAAL